MKVSKYRNAPCVLLEICFIDNQNDMNRYNLDNTCKAIFKAITGTEYDSTNLGVTEDTTSNSTITESDNTINTENTNTGIINGYNATIKNDWFYLRDSNGNKTNGTLEIGTKIKVLDVSYSKQLIYIAYLENKTEKKAYITNATNCIEYLYQDQWNNGSTKEIAYETSACKNSIGELSSREKATPFIEKMAYYMLYTTLLEA